MFTTQFWLSNDTAYIKTNNISLVVAVRGNTVTHMQFMAMLGSFISGAAIQRRGPILVWVIILSVYDADTIAIDLSLSALISWFMKSIIGFLNNYNLHAIIST